MQESTTTFRHVCDRCKKVVVSDRHWLPFWNKVAINRSMSSGPHSSIKSMDVCGECSSAFYRWMNITSD